MATKRADVARTVRLAFRRAHSRVMRMCPIMEDRAADAAVARALRAVRRSPATRLFFPALWHALRRTPRDGGVLSWIVRLQRLDGAAVC